MPRRDLTQERTAQILDSFERCVVERGLGGTSLEDVAAKAGVKRSIIRHYIGNRDELVSAMALRYTERFVSELNLLAGAATGARRMKVLLSAFFPGTPSTSGSDVVLVEALIAAADEYPDVAKLMTKLVRRTVETTRDVLQAEYPQADKSDVWEVAYGVVGISFNQESLVQLSLPPRFGRAALGAARRLISSLGSSGLD